MSSIRKTAYGRTELFLPSPGSIVREVKCMGGIQRYANASVYHMLPNLHETRGLTCCWHCCEPISGSGVVIPRMYDTTERVYYVMGLTCSPQCAKAYIIEHTSFERGQHLNVLSKMLREVYDFTGPLVAAPPKPSLKRFGGPFDTTHVSKVDCTLLHPPFVSYCMLVEERYAVDGDSPMEPSSDLLSGDLPVDEAEALDEPPPPSLFAQLVENGQLEHRPAASKRARDESGEAGSSSSVRPTGPLSKFVKPKK